MGTANFYRAPVRLFVCSSVCQWSRSNIRYFGHSNPILID